MAKAATKPDKICSGPSRGPEKQTGKRREGRRRRRRRSRKAHQKAKKKRPVQPGPEPQEAAVSLEGRIAVFEKNENQGLAQR